MSFPRTIVPVIVDDDDDDDDDDDFARPSAMPRGRIVIDDDDGDDEDDGGDEDDGNCANSNMPLVRNHPTSGITCAAAAVASNNDSDDFCSSPISRQQSLVPARTKAHSTSSSSAMARGGDAGISADVCISTALSPHSRRRAKATARQRKYRRKKQAEAAMLKAEAPTQKESATERSAADADDVFHAAIDGAGAVGDRSLSARRVSDSYSGDKKSDKFRPHGMCSTVFDAMSIFFTNRNSSIGRKTFPIVLLLQGVFLFVTNALPRAAWSAVMSRHVSAAITARFVFVKRTAPRPPGDLTTINQTVRRVRPMTMRIRRSWVQFARRWHGNSGIDRIGQPSWRSMESIFLASAFPRLRFASYKSSMV